MMELLTASQFICRQASFSDPASRPETLVPYRIIVGKKNF